MDGANGASSVGNTKPPRYTASLYWCFTLNNYNDTEYDEIINICTKNQWEYGIGKEGASKTPHLQGWISSKKRIRPMETIKNKRIHWEKCKGSKDQNIEYCKKEGLYTTNVKSKEEIGKLCKILTHEQLYPWQKDVVEMIKSEPDDRKILWIWDECGCTGKTALAKHLAFYYDAIGLDGKKNDMLYAASEKTNGNMEKIFIFQIMLSRTMEHFVSYDAIEKLKDGYWFSGKYESKDTIIRPPHVIILANFEPDKKKLSKDRWQIINLEEEKF